MRIRRVVRALLCLLPAAVTVMLAAVLSHFPAVTERVFSRGVFVMLSTVFGVTQYVPISLTECLAVVAVPALVVAAVVFVRARRRRGRALWATAGRVLGWVLSGAFTLYMLLHGFNYYRVPLAEQMGMCDTAFSADDLAALCATLARQASAAREECAVDERGCMALTAPLSETLAAGGEGYAALENDYPFLHGSVNRAKGVRLSYWWSYTGISGMYFPLLAEANINIAVPDSELPMTVAHELAHTRGFAHEDECNFLGVLACLSHPSPDWRYSGWLSAYMYASNSLYEIDPARCREVRLTECSDGVQQDLMQRAAYRAAYQGGVMEAADRVNSAFIRANGDEQGTARYDEVTRLLLMWFANEYQ